MSFEATLPMVLKHEGGFVNDPDDPGGATNKGITQKVYNKFRTKKNLPTRSVRYIQEAELIEIYHQQYWIDGKCDLLPPGTAIVHFDFAVNAGIGQAARTLQRVLGVKPDGKIGPITLQRVREFTDDTLVREYSAARREFYRGLAAKKKPLSKFLNGWLIRTDGTERKALAAVGRTDV